MIFWIAVAVLAAVVTYAITRPLAQKAGAPVTPHLADLAVYKDQLAEIETDAARGVINPAEAEAARAEVARRVLRQPAGDAVPAPNPTPASILKPIYIATSLALPVLSLALYLTFGAPGLPGLPLAERIASKPEGNNQDDLIAKVEAQLRQHPEDGRGWDVIAPVYMSRTQFDDAANAYASAIKLLGESPARLQGFANARIRVENGVVPDDARKALATLLAANPKLKEPRIWLALAKEQDGKLTEAAADYRSLLAESPADAPWKDAVEQRLALIEKAGPPSANKPTDAPSGTPQDNASPIDALPPADREAFIARMVDGLAERLKTNAKDKAGWLKLIRAYQVLGRKDDATQALANARAGLTGDTEATREVDDLAKSLGLGGG